jgi:hypothetical protein
MDETELESFFRREARDTMRDNPLEFYESTLNVNIESIAKGAINKSGHFVWYDMCCGDFIAGKEFVANFKNNQDLISKISVNGVDAYINSSDMEYVKLQKGNTLSYPLPIGIDLITCNTGIWYLENHLGEGKSIEALKHWFISLCKDGLIVFDMHKTYSKLANSIFDCFSEYKGCKITKSWGRSESKRYYYDHNIFKITKEGDNATYEKPIKK